MGPAVVYFKSDRPASKSGFFVKWSNTLSVLLSSVIIALGIWLASRPGDWEKYLTVPVFFVGAFFLLVAVWVFLGLGLQLFLSFYLFLMFLVLLTFLIVTIFTLVVTAPGGGYRINGQMFMEYRLGSRSKHVQEKGWGGAGIEKLEELLA